MKTGSYLTVLLLCCLLTVPSEEHGTSWAETSETDAHAGPVSPVSGAAQTSRLPDTAAGRRVADYFEAFNSENEDVMRQYLTSNLSPEAARQRPVEGRLEALRRIKTDAGALQLEKVTEAEEDALTVLASGTTGKWLEISFAFEPGAPHRLLGARFELRDGPPSLESTGPPMDETQLVAELSAYLDSLAARDEFSGVVLLAGSDGPIFRKAYGLASKEYEVPNTVDTRFNLGSINKFFTRIAIEQLVAGGAVSMDDTIGKFLPDYPNKEAAAKVTVSHLLDMSSGIGDFFGDRYESTPKDRIRDLADYLQLFGSEPLAFTPGTSNAYSNGGYVVLGMIVEKASGQGYFDYVREHICDPTGMKSTEHLEADFPARGVASGYTRDWDGKEHPGESRRNNIYTRPARGSSAGGGYSTADDLLKLVVALKAGVLGASGVSRSVAESGAAVAGGAPGINAYVETLPKTGHVVVVLSNYDPPAAMNVGRKVTGLVKRLK